MSFVVPECYVEGRNPFYREGVFLDPGVGNNGFSMDVKGARDSLWITPMKIGSLEDLKMGKRVVFQDFEPSYAPEGGASEVRYEWVESVGLQYSILCLDYDVPVYVVDNHNCVFYCWAENAKCKIKKEKMTLVHMDAHFDDKSPPNFDVDLHDLEDVFRYTNEVLQIATYIQPAVELGLFSEVVHMVESRHFENPPDILGDVVLNIDLDVFCDEMSHVSYHQKVSVMKKYLPQTKLITFATSPSFIGQKKAIEVCRRVVKNLFGL
jgi:hypothetical protein